MHVCASGAASPLCSACRWHCCRRASRTPTSGRSRSRPAGASLRCRNLGQGGGAADSGAAGRPGREADAEARPAGCVRDHSKTTVSSEYGAAAHGGDGHAAAHGHAAAGEAAGARGAAGIRSRPSAAVANWRASRAARAQVVPLEARRPASADPALGCRPARGVACPRPRPGPTGCSRRSRPWRPPRPSC